MNVAIFGAGYVGCVTAACLAKLGHHVWLVEVSPEKLVLLQRGESPVEEPGLPALLAEQFAAGRVHPTSDPVEAVRAGRVSLICVGTPSRHDGAPDMRFVEKVGREIAEALSQRVEPHTVVARSTAPRPALEQSLWKVLRERHGERWGASLTAAVNPEFLREGSAIHDFFEPPFVVIGSEHLDAVETLRALYAGLDCGVEVMTTGSASLVKYASNAFHAVKIAFANEIAALAPLFGADASDVMRVFCLDRILNISPAYLRPGFAYGGSCLPKDLRTLTRSSESAGVALPLMHSVSASNAAVVERAFAVIERTGRRRVTMLGLSFKVGTDDLRESPLVELAEKLIGKGYRLRIVDPDVRYERLMGRNLESARQRLRHLAELLQDDAGAALRDTELVIVGKKLPDIPAWLARAPNGVMALDLTRQFERDVAGIKLLQIEDLENG